MKFDIAVGKNRWEKKWRNETWTWRELKDALRDVRYTSETAKEYRDMDKDQRDRVKDIGGFVGGKIRGGRRLVQNISYRSLITLDIDNATSNFWRVFRMTYAEAAIVYSTHSNTERKPRLRLVMPLDRDVDHAEYEAICRRLADDMGMEMFDHTSFRVHQLMYWPSAPKNGLFEFHAQDGDCLCADDILDTYDDWTDISEWPTSDAENRLVERSLKKQGDPLEKQGIIGAFCRTYTIQEAIEKFLPDEYEETGDGRYTYLHGSTAGGLVIYDDRYAYSHHSTDPSSGQLCNAFDLVRLHLFGLEDEDAKAGTPTTKLPSYLAMLDTVAHDGPTKKTIVRERKQGAAEAFDERGRETPPDDDDARDDLDEGVDPEDWTEGLEIDRKGVAYATADNIALILTHDPKFKDLFAFDEFEQREVFLRNPYWRKVRRTSRGITDKDEAHIRHYLEKVYEISHSAKTRDAIAIVCGRHTIHPVRDYLNSLSWDGEQRLDYMLVDYMGAEPTEYVQTVTRKTMVAAVARVFKPGCKFDHCLVLSGPEGMGKSTLFSRLGGQWFSDSFTGFVGKDAYEQLHGHWIMEMGELAGLKRSEVETVKSFISKQKDDYRAAYGHRSESYLRQCIFIGTTEDQEFLRNINGNRRWWPVEIAKQAPEYDVFRLDEDTIAQLWAEAVALYREGEKLYLDRALEAKAREVRAEHIEADPRQGIVQGYLDAELPKNWTNMGLAERRDWLQSDDELKAKGIERRTRVCVAEVWAECLEGNRKDLTDYTAKSLHYLLKSIPGWRRADGKKARFGIYGMQRYYVRERGGKNGENDV